MKFLIFPYFRNLKNKDKIKFKFLIKILKKEKRNYKWYDKFKNVNTGSQFN